MTNVKRTSYTALLLSGLILAPAAQAQSAHNREIGHVIPASSSVTPAAVESIATGVAGPQIGHFAQRSANTADVAAAEQGDTRYLQR